MTTDESILQEMIDRATNPDKATADELAVEMFSMVVRSNADLIHKALDMIIEKISSSNVTEALRGVALLEQCMTKCGSEFQDVVDKFKFLNNLIRLVSTKYQGGETPSAIKTRIMQCLLLWTTEFPQKTKIRGAYDSLSKESREEAAEAAAAATKQESTLGIDEKMLAKLIHSNDPENFKRANLLIQHRVCQESRRTELLLQHKSEVQEVQNTVRLLNEMLDTYEMDDSSEENITLIRELYMICKKQKPIMQRLPDLIENTDQALITETYETNELLSAVLERYKTVVVHPKAKVQPDSSSPKKNVNSSNIKSSSDLLTELLSDLPATTTTTAPRTNGLNEGAAALASVLTPAKIATNSDTLAELKAIFSHSASDNNTPQSVKSPSEIFGSFDLLEPENVFSNDKNVDKENQQSNESKQKRGLKELNDIDQLSDELFKKNLPSVERIGTFKKEPEKVTLNDLVKDKINPKPEKTARNATSPTTPIKETAKSSVLNEINDLKDDLMLGAVADLPSEAIKDTVTPADTSNVESKIELPVKHLSEIEIDLDDVIPTAESRTLLDDDDVKVTFNFTKDRPSKHVSIVVISVVNKSKMQIKDFQFEASVKKPSKVRLLPPTDVTMPPYKPFRPPTPINQVLLLLNPTGRSVDVTCIVGYKLGDDPDPIKESIVVKDIHFVE